MSSSDRIVREMVVDGIDDWVPLRDLVFVVRQVAGDERAVVDLVTEVAETLLRDKLMAFGELGDPGFVPWPGDDEAVLRRLIAELDAVDWRPDTHSWWLANTDRGDEMGRQIEQEE
ncbi:hypothetical protein [Actinokineospora globicatena]|uniref:Uncharacterized protein n=1 Tax=Actinokineospora globicatena TaxID=103729 RepID=A0A9W6QNW2_9PSEU|nr:hypothetical protein [Actinokineospora globicatena]GLW91987.1 hypothetical protein Aglo03_28030 [Actinokineospora globicatena]